MPSLELEQLKIVSVVSLDTEKLKLVMWDLGLIFRVYSSA